MGVDALRAAVEQEARERIAGILDGARARARQLREQAESGFSERRARTLREAELALRRETAGRIARARRAARERVLEARQALLDRIFARAHEELPRVLEDEAGKAWMVELCERALRHMPPGPVAIDASSEMARVLEPVFAGRSDVRVAGDPEIPAGFLARSASGSLVVDATLPTLLDANRPRLAIDVLARLDRRSR